MSEAYGFIGLGAMEVTKTYQYMWFGDLHGPKPYKLIFGVLGSSLREIAGHGLWEIDFPRKKRPQGRHSQFTCSRVMHIILRRLPILII